MQKMGSTLDKVDAAPKDPRLRSRLEVKLLAIHRTVT